MYMSILEFARETGVPVQNLRQLCERKAIEGAVRFGRVWAIPESTKIASIPAEARKPSPQ